MSLRTGVWMFAMFATGGAMALASAHLGFGYALIIFAIWTITLVGLWFRSRWSETVTDNG